MLYSLGTCTKLLGEYSKEMKGKSDELARETTERYKQLPLGDVGDV